MMPHLIADHGHYHWAVVSCLKRWASLRLHIGLGGFGVVVFWRHKAPWKVVVQCYIARGHQPQRLICAPLRRRRRRRRQQRREMSIRVLINQAGGLLGPPLRRHRLEPQPKQGSGCGDDAAHRAGSSFRPGAHGCCCNSFSEILHDRRELLRASRLKPDRLRCSSGMLYDAGTKCGQFPPVLSEMALEANQALGGTSAAS